MAMTTIVTASISGLLLALSLLRIAIARHLPLKPSQRAILEFCVMLSLAKLLRTPTLSDGYVNPLLQRATSLANFTTFLGMTLAAAAMVPLSSFAVVIFQRRHSPIIARLAQLAIVVGMWSTYRSSQISVTPSDFISTDIPLDTPAILYWAIFLGTIFVGASTNLYISLQALALVRRGTFAVSLAGWAVTATIGCLYPVFKIVGLWDSHYNLDTWVAANNKAISLVLVLLIVMSSAVAIGLYPCLTLPRRIRRFRTLKRHASEWYIARLNFPEYALPGLLPSVQLRQCWRASKDPSSTFSMLVEIADATTAARRQ